MRSNAARALLGAALAIAAVVLFLVLQEDGDGGTERDRGGEGSATRTTAGRDGRQKPTAPPAAVIPTIRLEDGKPIGGVEELEFGAGDRIRFEVDSDVGDEIHVHGYDLSKEVEAGASARFDFPATIEGVFEVELEGRAEQIAELRVAP